jgi:hypothetical protein
MLSAIDRAFRPDERCCIVDRTLARRDEVCRLNLTGARACKWPTAMRCVGLHMRCFEVAVTSHKAAILNLQAVATEDVCMSAGAHHCWVRTSRSAKVSFSSAMER